MKLAKVKQNLQPLVLALTTAMQNKLALKFYCNL